jgi:hypothetical protein
MDVTFACPKCEQTTRAPIEANGGGVSCAHCAARFETGDALGKGEVKECAICSCGELYVRKDFPQRVGVSIVILGFAASCVTWYLHMPMATFGVLFLTALVDLLLYLFMRDSLVCYRCGAQYRDASNLERHAAFDLEAHERHRQHAARLRQEAAGASLR